MADTQFAPVPDPYDIDLATMDVSKAEIFLHNMQGAYFRRLRQEDPVHYCPDSLFGPYWSCLLYTSPSPRDKRQSRMPSSA